MRLALIGALLLTAAGAVWLSGQPIGLVLRVGDETVRLGAAGAIAAAALLMLAAVFLWEVARAIKRLPTSLARKRHDDRRARAIAALSDGLVAVAAGDAPAANRAAQIAARDWPDAPLTHLLTAQAAQLRRDGTAAAHFGALASHASARPAGLRGLAMEAARRGNHEVALASAEAAHGFNPSLAWACEARLAAALEAGDFDGALERLEEAARAGAGDTQANAHRRALILTAKADALQPIRPADAHRLALNALQLAPNLVPAAVIAARTAGPGRQQRAALTAVFETYRRSPHPDLFAVALGLAGAEGAEARLARAEALAALAPHDPESLLGLGTVALTAGAPDRARACALAALRLRPTRRATILLADAEAAAGSNAARIRDALATADRALPDPAWIGDGKMLAAWQPLSPVTRTLDGVTWAASAPAARSPGEPLAWPDRSTTLPQAAPAKALPPPDPLSAATATAKVPPIGEPQPREPAAPSRPATSVPTAQSTDRGSH